MCWHRHLAFVVSSCVYPRSTNHTMDHHSITYSVITAHRRTMPVLIMKYHCIIAPYHRTVPVPSMKSHCTTPPYQRTALHNHDMSSHHCTVPSYRTLQQRTWLPYVPDFACILEMMVTPILNLHKFTWMLWMKPFLTKVVCFFRPYFSPTKNDCFTGQPPSNAISITAALHVHEKVRPKSLPQFFVGGLGLGWLAAPGAGAF